MSSISFHDKLLQADWNEYEEYAHAFEPSVSPDFVYTEPLSSVPPQATSLLWRVGCVAFRILSLVWLPLTLVRSASLWTGRYLHQCFGSFLFFSHFKDRKQVLHFVKNWDVLRPLMATPLFSAFLFMRLGMVRVPRITGVSGAAIEPLLRQLGVKDTGLCHKWFYRRFNVQSEGMKVDAFFMRRKPSPPPSPVRTRTERFVRWCVNTESSSRPAFSPTPGRVLFYCCSQDELAEGKLLDKELLSLADQACCDEIVVYNHPGVGASEGAVDRESLVKAHRAMLRFLEQGLGAKEIVGYGHSLGAAVQLEALGAHSFTAAKYVAVLSSPASYLKDALTASLSSWLGRAVSLLGWNFDNVSALSKLKAPAVLIQTASVPGYTRVSDEQELIPDTVLEDRRVTLGHAVLTAKSPCDIAYERRVVGLPRCHDDNLTPEQVVLLGRDVNAALV